MLRSQVDRWVVTILADLGLRVAEETLFDVLVLGTVERERRERAELVRREREADEIRQRLRMYLSAGVTPPEELVAAAEGADAPTDALP